MTAVTAERLAAAARAQRVLPGAAVSDVRRAWEGRLPGLYGVSVEGGERGGNAFLRVAGDRVAVPAGPAQAARELRELGALDGEPWGGGLIYIVTAVGGATPGFPDTWDTGEEPLGDGGVRITVHMTEAWVRYAAAGGVGPEPPEGFADGFGGRGDSAPPPMATATLEVTAAYGLRWSYQLPGEELDGPAGVPAERPPVLPDDRLVAALDAARRRAGAPRAMPATEPLPAEDDPSATVVDLWAIGPVRVEAGELGGGLMSITAIREIPCRACGHMVRGVTIESANPVRHPPFQVQLLDRTLLRRPCPNCGEEHLHFRRFMWADLAGRLCAIVVHESEKPDWPELETEARETLVKPFREEGPLFVREMGDETSLRLAFGLEELREKVVCRLGGLDDRVVEAMKEDLPHGSRLEAVEPGVTLTFVEARAFDVGWDRYEEAAARARSDADAVARELPGIFDPRATWVNAARSRRAPLTLP